MATIEDLLERDAELALLGRLARGLRGHGGRVVLIEGSPGIGKSALLAAMREQAESSGVRVLSGGGDELERKLPYGVVRQLFEPVAAAASQSARLELFSGAAELARPVLLLEERGAVAESDPSAALHGLYWLCASLSERDPLALLIDDVQWVDSASLRWFAYLARRLEDLPVLVALAVRGGEFREELPLLAALAARPETERLTLRPLNADATAQLVTRAIGTVADPAFSHACHRATGG